MSFPKYSIIISNYKRIDLLRRTLFALSQNDLYDTEVVIADELSDESELVIEECKRLLPKWTVIQCNYDTFYEQTGFQKTGNPSWTNNVAFVHSKGRHIITLGNEIICDHEALLNIKLRTLNLPINSHYLFYASTYDLPQTMTNRLDFYGRNLSEKEKYFTIEHFPLYDQNIQPAVTNYLSVCPRITWELLGGYDENYCRGKACDDSDFSRRAKRIPDLLSLVMSDVITFHQYHGGITTYYNHLKDQNEWDKLVAINREYYYKRPDTEIQNPQTWPIGLSAGFKIITNS